jgi:hypothetical protein
LEGWANNLKEPFDQYPWVEKHGDETVLRSASFDNLASAQEVSDLAVPMIERLNCMLALSKQLKPAQLGAVIQFKSDGTQHRHLIIEAANLTVSGCVIGSPAIGVIGPDGKPLPPPPPQPSEAQRWLAVAENEKFLDDALKYFRERC